MEFQNLHANDLLRIIETWETFFKGKDPQKNTVSNTNNIQKPALSMQKNSTERWVQPSHSSKRPPIEKANKKRKNPPDSLGTWEKANSQIKEGFSKSAIDAGLGEEWDAIFDRCRAQSTKSSYSGILAEANKRVKLKLKTSLFPILSPTDLLEKLMIITQKQWALSEKGHSWAYLNSLKHALGFNLRLEGRDEWLNDQRISLMFDSRRREGSNIRKEKFVVTEPQISALDAEADAAWQKLSILKHARWSPSGMWLAAWSILRDLAILKLGFFTVRRCKELTDLDLSNIEWSESDSGYWITITQSKTDQIGVGRKIFWPSSLGTAALKRYLDVRQRLLKSCTEGLWEVTTALFVNLSGKQIGKRMSLETMRKLLKKRIPVPPGSNVTGVPSIRRGGAEWWMKCPDSDKARMIARSMGGWKSFQMLDTVYRQAVPEPAEIMEVVEKRHKIDNSSVVTVTENEKHPKIEKTKKSQKPVTLVENSHTVVGRAQIDIAFETERRKVLCDLNRVDDEVVPGVILECIAKRILKLNSDRRNTFTWANLRGYKMYALLKTEILGLISQYRKDKDKKKLASTSAEGHSMDDTSTVK